MLAHGLAFRPILHRRRPSETAFDANKSPIADGGTAKETAPGIAWIAEKANRSLTKVF
jgi:hypothetical protein